MPMYDMLVKVGENLLVHNFIPHTLYSSPGNVIMNSLKRFSQFSCALRYLYETKHHRIDEYFVHQVRIINELFLE